VIVGDGAWGTMLMARGLGPGDCPEQVNLDRPEVLREIARLYLEAGAELITTNTFGGSPLKLERYGLDGRTEDVNRLAVEVVKETAAGRAWVSASIGPTGRLLKPFGDVDPEELAEGFTRQARALVEAGADLVCVETMTDLTEATLAVEAVRSAAPDLPVMATMTFDATPRGYFTIMGSSVEQACAALVEAGADVVGSNCGNGVEKMVEIAREFANHATVPIAIQSNAGLPEHREGVLIWPESPEIMAARVPELIDLGVKIIGGCCGTGPDHIRAIRSAVDAHR
jgi:5-methyltetrahydrofolate--homocysteine methyltransferase